MKFDMRLKWLKKYFISKWVGIVDHFKNVQSLEKKKDTFKYHK